MQFFFSRRQLQQGALPAVVGGSAGGGRGGAKGGRCGRSCQVKIGISHIFIFFILVNIFEFLIRLYDSLALKGNLDEEVVDHVDK